MRSVNVIFLTRRDPARNIARFYVMCLEPDLFGAIVLVQEWGRIGGLTRLRKPPQSLRRTTARQDPAWLSGRRIVVMMSSIFPRYPAMSVPLWQHAPGRTTHPTPHRLGRPYHRSIPARPEPAA
ncbi:WGR domain-containing protein (plasmid) [Microvirga sp. VF16]|nr:WGR domain-containing protein [Microvirga sp. VF16]